MLGFIVLTATIIYLASEYKDRDRARKGSRFKYRN